LKEVPAILSKSGKPETAMTMIGFHCVECGIMMSLRPEEPKKDEGKSIILTGGHA
jgi:hypothetical protein